MKSIFTLLLFTFVFGCGFKQDPLDGRDGSIQNAIPPTQQKPDPAKPVQSDIVRVDSVKFFSFLEGRKDELTIQSRFLGKDHETKIEIENIVDFPGASFDQSTGKFSWTPSLGTVLGSDMYSQMSLKAVVFATPTESAEDQTVYTTRQDILVIINRTKKVPEIVSVSANFPDSITENDSSSSRTFTVTVRDSDSVDGSINQPRLAILPAQKTIQKNFSPYLRIIRSTQSSADPSLWDFTLGIEISKSELTISRDVYGVSFQAYSAFGIASAPIEKTMTVYNDMAQAMTNQTDDFVVDPLVTTQLTFFVFDPKNEGSLVIDPLRFNLPKNAALVCKSKTPSLSVCVLTVTPAKEQANTRMQATFLVKNTNTMDSSKYKTSSISINILVNKLPPPPPPAPEPPAPPVNPPAPESPEVPNPSQPVQP